MPDPIVDPVGDPTPPAAVDPTPDPVPYDWRADIHPDVKADKVWESVPDLKTLTKAYADATKYNVGALKLPAADAPPEEWAKVYDKLGRPSSPEGYQIPEQVKTPTIEAMRGVAHTAGVNSKQWDTIMAGLARTQQDQLQAQKEESTAATDQLKADWGGAYDRNLGLVQRVIRTYMGDDGLETVVKSGLGNNVSWLKGMATMAKALEEQGVINGDVEGVMGKEAAKDALDTLTLSKEYMDASHPNHRQTVEKVTKLFELLYS